MAGQRWAVDFWLDPSCPLTWLTARWIRTVAEHRRVDIRWRVMSLSILNEGREADPEGDAEGYLWFPARICAAVQAEHGHEALGRFHHALWTAESGDVREWADGPNQALVRAGLPERLTEVGGGTEYDSVLRASHEGAMALVEGEVGTPILAVEAAGEPRRAFFGPVVDTPLEQEDALRLWEGVLLVSGVPAFRELKR